MSAGPISPSIERLIPVAKWEINPSIEKNPLQHIINTSAAHPSSSAPKRDHLWALWNRPTTHDWLRLIGSITYPSTAGSSSNSSMVLACWKSSMRPLSVAGWPADGWERTRSSNNKRQGLSSHTGQTSLRIFVYFSIIPASSVGFESSGVLGWIVWMALGRAGTRRVRTRVQEKQTCTPRKGAPRASRRLSVVGAGATSSLSDK